MMARDPCTTPSCRCCVVFPRGNGQGVPPSNGVAVPDPPPQSKPHMGMMHHDASWSIMMHHDASWCIMMHHDLSWFIMNFRELSWRSAKIGRSPENSDKNRRTSAKIVFQKSDLDHYGSVPGHEKHRKTIEKHDFGRNKTISEQIEPFRDPGSVPDERASLI